MTDETSPQPHKKGLFRPRNILIVVIGVWILASVPVWFFQSNPPVANEPAWDSPQTRELARRTCFDCHSNETTWPIYSRMAPVSYIVTNHVMEGREHLNFSEWGNGGGQAVVNEADLRTTSGLHPAIAYANGGEEEEEEEHGKEDGEGGEGGEGHEGNEGPGEMIETIQEGEMPLQDYLWLHPEARLSPTEQQQLIDGIRATFR